MQRRGQYFFSAPSSVRRSSFQAIYNLYQQSRANCVAQEAKPIAKTVCKAHAAPLVAAH